MCLLLNAAVSTALAKNHRHFLPQQLMTLLGTRANAPMATKAILTFPTMDPMHAKVS
jgi:hypothetical protein